MEIVDRLRFVDLPAGTIYSLYETVCFNGLFVKEDTVEGTRDFHYRNILSEVRGVAPNKVKELVERVLETRETIELCTDTIHLDDVDLDDTQYAIWDDAAIEGLAQVLQNPTRREFWYLQSRVSWEEDGQRWSSNSNGIQVNAYMQAVSKNELKSLENDVSLQHFIKVQLDLLIGMVNTKGTDCVLHFDMGPSTAAQRGYLAGALEMTIYTRKMEGEVFDLEVDPLLITVKGRADNGPSHYDQCIIRRTTVG